MTKKFVVVEILGEYDTYEGAFWRAKQFKVLESDIYIIKNPHIVKEEEENEGF